jgi:hypothetical protein
MSSRISINPFFTPTQISGCQLWLDAADPNGNGIQPANRTLISTWRDKSTSANHASIVSGYTSPTYITNSLNARPGLFFSNSVLSTQNPIQLRSFFGVCLTQQNASLLTGAGSTANNPWSPYYCIIRQENPVGNALFLLSFTTGTPSYPNYISTSLNTNYIFAGTYDGISQMYNTINGSAPVSNSFVGGTPKTATATYIGGDWFNGSLVPSLFMLGPIYEIISYSGFIDTVQRQQIEGYLAWKWGLQGSLPANHPYKSSPIPPLSNPPVTVPTGTAITSYVGWSPLNVPRCGLWLDAADPSTFNYSSGSNVSVWTDKSAGIPAQFLTNAMATARAGTSPNGDIGKLGSTNYPVSGYNINGVNCLYFNQAILQAITTQSTTTRTYFAVVRFPSPFTSGALLWPATWSSIYAFGGSIQVNSTGVIFASQNVANLLALNYSTDTPFIISITFNNGTTNMWNTGGGTTIPTGQTSATLGSSDNYLWIGGVSGYYMSPYLMGEFLEYNSALSTSQRQQVEGYLAWKWGLSGSLPATHPYKSFPPSTRSTIVPVSVAKTATWQPTQISGCQLWLDATDASTITLNGTTVTSWRDKRGNYTMTSVAGTPTYTKSSILSSQYVVRFNGTNDSILYNGFTLAQPFTVFAVTVQRGSTPSGYSQVIGSSSGISAVILYTNIVPTTLTFYAGNNVVLSPNIQYSFNIPGVYSSVFNGTSSFLGFNGTGQSNLNPGTLGWSGIYLGRDFNNTFTSQDVGEIIYYNSALNTAQRQQTEGYLAWKWGLQGSLPSNHPFKLWPPPP